MKDEAFVTIAKFRQGMISSSEDLVAVEEPLEIYLDGIAYHLTMRLPGQEKELAAGHIFAEGIIESRKDINLILYCGEETGNRVDVSLAPQRKSAQGLSIKEWRKPSYSSCGICGQDILGGISGQIPYRSQRLSVTQAQIQKAIHTVMECQDAFDKTGGTHAAGIFDQEFKLIAFAEDIGRHNALDKAVGNLVLTDKLADIGVVVLTSRLSYEMVQKVSRTNAELLIGMSSPTSLGIGLARQANLTMIGFARKHRFNIYSGLERLSSGYRPPD